MNMNSKLMKQKEKSTRIEELERKVDEYGEIEKDVSRMN